MTGLVGDARENGPVVLAGRDADIDAIAAIVGPLAERDEIKMKLAGWLHEHDVAVRLWSEQNPLHPDLGGRVEPRTDRGLESLADEIADQAYRGLDREEIATALHNLLCHDDHDVPENAWRPTPGGMNRYQRHADALLRLTEWLRS